jgi:hypothetical protein
MRRGLLLSHSSTLSVESTLKRVRIGAHKGLHGELHGVSMTGSPFIISFPGTSTAEANRLAAGLASAIRDAHRDVKVEQKRDQPDTQDFGATLAVILGTASVTAVAKGVEAWLARHSGAKIQINKDGSVIASNLDSRDAARIAEVFKPRR